MTINPATFSDAREIDLTEDSDEYKIRWIEEDIRKNMRMLFNNMSDEGKRESLKAAIYKAMSGQFKNTYGEQQITRFIKRVVEDMESPDVEACYDSIGNVTRAITDAVRSLADDFCEDRFEKLLSRGDVKIQPRVPLS